MLHVNHQPIRRRGVDRVIALLRVTDEMDPRRWHRDGWIFQMLSWIAAQKSATSRTLIKAPQPRTADKGLDGLMISLQSGSQRPHLIIGEDKATTNARDTITGKVWPELDGFEAGDRDPEVTSDVEVLLSQIPEDSAREDLIKSILWEEKWRYRVAITIDSESDSSSGRTLLFGGYDTHVVGPNSERRRAETYMVDDLRTWMDLFCEKIIANLEEMREAADV